MTRIQSKYSGIRCLVRLFIPALLIVLCSTPARSQQLSGIESGVRYDNLSNSLDTWKSVHIKGFTHTSPNDYWHGEANFANKLDENGFLYALMYRRTISDDWFGVVSGATSSGGFFNPRYMIATQVGRKFAKGKLISILGGGIYRAKDEHRDVFTTAEAVFYAPHGIVFQGGVRLNISSPGDAFSRYHNLSITKFKSSSYQVGAQVGFGNEAYEIIDPLTIYTDFNSWNTSLTGRAWIKNGWGVQASVSYYESDFYNRTGVSLGVFREF